MRLAEERRSYGCSQSQLRKDAVRLSDRSRDPGPRRRADKGRDQAMLGRMLWPSAAPRVVRPVQWMTSCACGGQQPFQWNCAARETGADTIHRLPGTLYDRTTISVTTNGVNETRERTVRPFFNHRSFQTTTTTAMIVTGRLMAATLHASSFQSHKGSDILVLHHKRE